MGSSNHEQERKIGTYTPDLNKKLGSGAYADVYVAEDKHGNEVAFKLFKKPGDDHFRREADILKQLKHPYILSYENEGEYEQIGYGKRPYIVVELARGGTLREYIKNIYAKSNERKFPYIEQILVVYKMLEILAQIAEAISAVHDLHILHRDITPENILLDNKKNPTRTMLADFGIALQLFEGINEMTSSDGNFLYMAPERFDSGRKPSPKSDQYALGCIAYELFTGLHPLGRIATLPHEERAEMEKLHNEAGHHSPCEDNRKLPEHIGAAILQAIEIDPDKRHKDIDAFLRAIEEGFVNSPETSKEATVPAEKDAAETSQPQPALPLTEKATEETLRNLRLVKPFDEFKNSLGEKITVIDGTLIDSSGKNTRYYNCVNQNNNYRILIYIPKEILTDLSEVNLHRIKDVFADFSGSGSSFIPKPGPGSKKFIIVFSTIDSIGQQIKDIIKPKWWEVSSGKIPTEFVSQKDIEELMETIKRLDGENKDDQVIQMQKKKLFANILEIPPSEIE